VSYNINKKNEEEKSSDTEDFDKHCLDALPKSKGFDSTENFEKNDDILLKKATKCQATKPAQKQTIVPCLLEFKDIEKENKKSQLKLYNHRKNVDFLLS